MNRRDRQALIYQVAYYLYENVPVSYWEIFCNRQISRDFIFGLETSVAVIDQYDTCARALEYLKSIDLEYYMTFFGLMQKPVENHRLQIVLPLAG